MSSTAGSVQAFREAAVGQLVHWRVPEPARLVAVEERLDRCGFASPHAAGASSGQAYVFSRTSDDELVPGQPSPTRAAPSGGLQQTAGRSA